MLGEDSVTNTAGVPRPEYSAEDSSCTGGDDNDNLLTRDEIELGDKDRLELRDTGGDIFVLADRWLLSISPISAHSAEGSQ